MGRRTTVETEHRVLEETLNKNIDAAFLAPVLGMHLCTAGVDMMPQQEAFRYFMSMLEVQGQLECTGNSVCVIWSSLRDSVSGLLDDD